MDDIYTILYNDVYPQIEWAEHSRQVWYDPDYDQIQAEFWLEHADEEMLDWHMANSVEGSIIKYSLPLPHWFKQNQAYSQ